MTTATTLPPQASASCVTPYRVFIVEDRTMKLFIVMVQKGQSNPVHIAHFYTKEEAENFLS